MFNPPPPDSAPPSTYGTRSHMANRGLQVGVRTGLRRGNRDRVLGPHRARRLVRRHPGHRRPGCARLAAALRRHLRELGAHLHEEQSRLVPGRPRLQDGAVAVRRGVRLPLHPDARSSTRTSASAAATRSCTRHHGAAYTSRRRWAPFPGTTASAGIIDRGWEFANLTLGFDARINRGVGHRARSSAGPSASTACTRGTESASIAGTQVVAMPVPPVSHGLHELSSRGSAGPSTRDERAATAQRRPRRRLTSQSTRWRCLAISPGRTPLHSAPAGTLPRPFTPSSSVGMAHHRRLPRGTRRCGG